VKSPNAADATGAAEVRHRILKTASELVYREGVRAVGVDRVVEQAGVAKTSLYRHFGTKADLVAAFLSSEDRDFWGTWDRVAERESERPETDATTDGKAHPLPYLSLSAH
jgi:AcrR family transcriptional regulator